MAVIVAALVSGALFGAGLALSGMIDPAVVLGFVDVAGDWNPRLLFVMAGALTVSMPAFALARRRAKPRLSDVFQIPSRGDIDVALIFGACLFGLGWGLAGICPGPAIAGLATGASAFWIFLPAMAGGFVLHRLWERARARR